MNFLLDVNKVDISAPIENFGDILLYGGQMLLIGLLTVFSVLTLLWVALVGFKLLFHDLASGRKKKEVKNESAPAPQASTVTDSGEIIAVIAAAIAMAESECGGNKSFRVVSFKRK
jgi:sodium pump decarboxylase gamma subunit